jgi:predicted permease
VSVTQIALSVMLLIGAGLLLRSFARLLNVDPGFAAGRVLTLELSLSGRKYPDAAAVRQAYRDLWERLDRLPGVTSSGGVTSLPLSGFFAWGPITVEGRVPPPGEKFINADMRSVGGRYFHTMRIPLIRGRFFDERDTPDQPRVVIVDERMAADLWPNADPIGKRLKFGDANAETPWETVVGIVGRVKQYALDADSRIALYRPHLQSPARSLYVVVQGRTQEMTTLGAVVRDEIRRFDADLPVYRMRPVTQLVDASLARQRFSLLLLAAFATVALLLAAVGLYGVMTYLVAQSVKEIGIRLALGATQARMLGLVLAQGLALAGAGCTLGIVGALALARVMEALVFGVTTTDPIAFAAASAGLGLVALVATLGPARRAARVDPLISLRSE